MRDYRKIQAWQMTHKLAKAVYLVTKSFPDEERFGLSNQLRRAVLSVPTNIVEGASRQTKRDYSHFLNIAWASLKETEYLLFFSSDMGFLSGTAASTLQQRIDACCSKLAGLQSCVKEEIE